MTLSTVLDALPGAGAPNSTSARDRESLIHPMTDLIRHAKEGPLVIERGEGVFVYDDAGRRYIEGVSGLRSISLGFGQETLAEAASPPSIRRDGASRPRPARGHGRA
jgi:4-aminobutyrate aminotransferase-like enzyme